MTPLLLPPLRGAHRRGAPSMTPLLLPPLRGAHRRGAILHSI